jgi:hypothetical protein
MTLDLNRFGLPAEAAADLPALQSRVAVSQGRAGVSMHYSGHDAHGLGFRFFVHEVYNKIKSEATKSRANPAGIEIFDPVECREIFVDRMTRAIEIVTNKTKQRFPDEYARFVEQREAPGTPLDKWGIMPSNEYMTLLKDGIFTVEQFALQSSDKVQGRYPPAFYDYFIRAQQFVAAKTGHVEVKEMADNMAKLQRDYAQLQEQMAALMSAQPKAKGKSKGKSKAKPKGRIITEEDFNQ